MAATCTLFSLLGGYQRAATVLAELIDSVDISKMKDVMPYTSIATMQRLGYLLEFILLQQDKADLIYFVSLARWSPCYKNLNGGWEK